MANEEHLAILEQGVEAWNQWRQTDSDVPDLTGVELRRAHLYTADLSHTDLRDADLCDADLRDTSLRNADLRNADLRGTFLTDANFSHAELTGANLSGATLTGTNFSDAKLDGADLNDVVLNRTIFGSTDLSDAKGLENCEFWTPCIIDDKTMALSSPLPEDFLRGCGLADWQIEAAKLYHPELTPTQITDIVYTIDRLRSTRPIQVANLFISYSHDDAEFVDHIEKFLNERGVRHWRDIHDAPAGPLESIVVRAMRDATVLLVLSENSVKSDWVEFEATKARELEKKEPKRHVLCPIALDSSWRHCDWPGKLRNQIEKYHVLDFSSWRDSAAFDDKLERLLSGLNLFYSSEPS